MTFRSLLKIIFALLCLVLAGRITLYLGSDIPVSAQTFAVLCLAYFFHVKETLSLYGLYWGLGILGLPVFADGASGWSTLSGNSGGYIFGFGLAALYIAYFHPLPQRLSKIALSMFVGTLLIMGVGFLRLAQLTDVGVAWTYGIQPFIIGALIKGVLGVLLLAWIQKFLLRQQAA
jgi:biotin transport system substrate-specific component